VTVGEWLERRIPAPPPALATRLRRLLAEQAPRQASEAAEACLVTAEGLLERLLLDGCAGREHALDLLAADALVTYAFEAAADDPSRLADRARLAMLRISAVGMEAPEARDAFVDAR
jgi:hypothetical protein